MYNPLCWCGCRAYEPHARFPKVRQGQTRDIRIVRCTGCGTVRMLDNDIEALPDYQASYTYERLSPRHHRTAELVEEHGRAGSLLDVGANTGILAQEIQDRVSRIERVKGIDLDRQAIAYGRSRYSVELDAVDVAEVEESFDNVVLCHTLEHVFDLHGFLHQVDGILSPGGRVFIAVPNIRALTARLLLRAWPALAPEYHVWYFDAETLGAAVRAILPGYRVALTSSFFIWRPFYVPGPLWRVMSKTGVRAYLERHGLGDQLDMILVKPGAPA